LLLRSVRRSFRAAAAALLGLLAARSISPADLAQPGTSVSALPLIEVPARGGRGGGVLVVLLSADGGWARLDREVAAHLSRAGVPVVGWNSLAYYAHRRTPAQAANALAAVLRHYLPLWGRDRAVLVGYSFGADVLPLLVNRLPPDVRGRVAGVALLGFSADAEFQFHLQDWMLHVSGPRYATLPEARRLRPLPVLCVHGRGDPTSACEKIGTPNVTLYVTHSGHGLGSMGDTVSMLLLRQIHGVDRQPNPPVLAVSGAP
jgi:type IV secretory pathway VirJ component